MPATADAVTIPSTVEHFRDGKYFNPGAPDHNFRAAWKWMRNRKPGVWREWIPSQPGPKPPMEVEGSELRVTWVNHSTVLLQMNGINILTDPVWSERVSPVRFTGPKRHRAPGLRFEDLPPIHLLLISHNHYDHFDTSTLKRLARRGPDQPAVFCPLGLEKPLRRIGFRQVHALDWWQEQSWRDMRIHCVPAQHFSARWPWDRNRTLWCGWLVETGAGNVYFAGDTGFSSVFEEIRARFPAIRLALLPIGAYDPEWFMGPIHMTPEQALEARSILSAEVAMGIHFGTFALADDGETDPANRLRQALDGRADAQQFWIVQEGEGRLVP